MLLLICDCFNRCLIGFGSYAAIASQQKLERAPVHNLDADQIVGFIN